MPISFILNDALLKNKKIVKEVDLQVGDRYTIRYIICLNEYIGNHREYTAAQLERDFTIEVFLHEI